MSGGDELMDVPIVWEKELVAPEHVVRTTPADGREEEELSEGADSNVAQWEEESEDDMAEVTGFVMLSRRGLIARVVELKEKVRRLKRKGNSPSKEEGCSKSSKSVKRKWNERKSEHEEGRSKKNKTGACKSCQKKHAGMCLRGKGVCYNCNQEGHITPQCPEPKKGGCFKCGAADHQVKHCPKKKGVGQRRVKHDPTTSN